MNKPSNVNELKTLIAQDDARLDQAYAAWDETTDIKGRPDVREGYKAWTWCLDRLLERGMNEEQATSYRSVYMKKAHRMGTFESIMECVFGDGLIIFG